MRGEASGTVRRGLSPFPSAGMGTVPFRSSERRGTVPKGDGPRCHKLGRLGKRAIKAVLRGMRGTLRPCRGFRFW
jgi:hypothetical protein